MGPGRSGPTSVSRPWSPSDLPQIDVEGFNQLIKAITVEERVRSEILENVKILSQEANNLLGCRKGRKAEADKGDGSSGQRRARKGKSDCIPPSVLPEEFVEWPPPPKPERHIALRPCACGCGKMVAAGEARCEGKVAPLARVKPEELLSSEFGSALHPAPLSPNTQKASIERLFKRKAPAIEPEPPPSVISTGPDMRRLQELAVPREEVRKRKEIAQSQSLPALVPAPAPKPSKPPKVKTPSDEEKGAVKLPSIGPVWMRTPRRQDPAMQRPQQVAEPRPESAGSGRFVAYDPCWNMERRPTRSLKQLQSYVEERLYKAPAEPPNSIAALERKLQKLREERRGRERAAQCIAL